jgi:hypothetical protein
MFNFVYSKGIIALLEERVPAKIFNYSPFA